MNYQVDLCDTVEHLASLRQSWEAIDGDVPFRSFDWLSTWWQYYGKPAGNDRLQLHVLVVRQATGDRTDCSDTKQVLAIAPWYTERSRTRGVIIRPLGGGEVCSDHLTVLCHDRHSYEVARALAEYLAGSQAWDRLELDAIDEHDQVIDRLASELAIHKCETNVRPDGNCWVVNLPASWEEYLAMQSKSHRKNLRRVYKRVLSSDRAVMHVVRDEADFAQAWPLFVDLHQRRRKSLGEPGCFASHSFANFHHEVALKMLAAGRLRLSWLELDGQAVSAEYQFAGQGTTYAYQGGVEPDRLDDEPGRLTNIATLQAAIAEGHKAFDYMRGDEPYKAHWRATPRPTYHLQVLSPSHATNWLAQTADWADSMASALKAGLRPLVSNTQRGL